jgi:integrase
MAKPYRVGDGWAFRLRVNGEDIYRQGFSTEAGAKKALTELKSQVTSKGRPAHRGPWKTTLAEALLNYGLERLPGLKGADQEARRINLYLRLAGLPTLRVVPLPTEERTGVVYCRVELTPPSSSRLVPQGLSMHRELLATKATKAERIRSRLARTPLAEIQPYDIKGLLSALTEQGLGAASIHLEVAPLRQLFNYARRTWQWKFENGNPVSECDLPTLDNARDRVLTNAEWGRICKHLPETHNVYVAHALALLLESAMRCSEALVQICWQDLDEEAGLLKLRAAKAGWRYVPLTLSALDVLHQLREHALQAGPIHPGMRVLRLSYEALKAAWNRVCERAGVMGVRLHDLRHTSATRFALELNGNMPVLKIITGHKTDSQLLRYINIKPDDVARLLQGRPLSHDSAPAGLRVIRAEGVRVLPGAPAQNLDDLPQNVVPFRARRATP